MSLTVSEKMRLAHVSETHVAETFFAIKGEPITAQEARRLAFVSWCVYTRRLCEWLDARPRHTTDPRRRFQP